MLHVTRKKVERVAFDIGGTFTDVILSFDDGSIETLKILSLLETVGDSIREELGPYGGMAGSFVHGTTVATNAILEDKLAKVALFTTKGFRDILEMRTQRRPNIYDVNWTRTKSIVPREAVFEISERMKSDGGVHVELDRAEAAQQIAAAREAAPGAIAICLINSYRNPAHEMELEALIAAAGIKVPVSASHAAFGEIREYERTSTTVVNAALRPIVGEYLTRLERQLGASGTDIRVMQSNGGLISSASARQRPVNIIESGPAAGVMAAARVAREAELPLALAFDMGGTTAKATLIQDGKPLEKPSGEVGAELNMASRFYGGWGHAVQVPSLDIAEVSAGGGSIAWIDHGGALRVGPQGAGAQPGPVCYGRGGSRPTVTDANVVLGYINPAGLAGSTVAIDVDAAAAAIEKDIARPLRMSLHEAARGIIRVANATTMRALRAVSIERGVDPRHVAMIAFGGSGPVHAVELAASLGARTVLIPPFPGIFSAVGLLLAEYRYDAVRSVLAPAERVDGVGMRALLAELRSEVHAAMQAQNVPATSLRIEDFIDVRYRGQDKFLTLAIPSVAESDSFAERISSEFALVHRDMFGYQRSESAEIVAIRVRGTAGTGSSSIGELGARSGSASRDRSWGTRAVCFDPGAGLVELPTLSRAALPVSRMEGPMIVEEWDTSTVVPPGWTAQLDRLGNILLEASGDRANG